jgi:hypothetical protein
MKKADNFDAAKWLVENKVTSQSRINEENEKLNNGNDSLDKDWKFIGNDGNGDPFYRKTISIDKGDFEYDLTFNSSKEGKTSAFNGRLFVYPEDGKPFEVYGSWDGSMEGKYLSIFDPSTIDFLIKIINAQAKRAKTRIQNQIDKSEDLKKTKYLNSVLDELNKVLN